MKNYIGFNIKYLCEKNFLNQDDFGLLFDLKKGVIGTYVREISNPKIEIIQRICLHYKISIDDFVNTDLSVAKAYGIKQGELLHANDNETKHPYAINPRYVDLLEKSIQDKDKIIKSLEEKLQGGDKSKTA